MNENTDKTLDPSTTIQQSSTYNIYNAILLVRKEALKPIVADTINPMYAKKYATLQAIMEFLGPIMLKHDLILTSRFCKVDDVWGVLSELVWCGGRQVESVSAFFPGDRIADAQQMGKLYTYARRYNLTALLNLTFAEDPDDDDGNSLVKKKTTTKVAPKPLPTSNL